VRPGSWWGAGVQLCGAESLLGETTVSVVWGGVGASSTGLSGKVYMAGPYKGAPFGLAVVVPALAGPFDLGTVVVREALDIDSVTA
jgi:hypothetical protein